MIYLRNTTKRDQWLEDPYTGIKRRVAADELARVSPQVAEHVLRTGAAQWELVTPIAPPPP